MDSPRQNYGTSPSSVVPLPLIFFWGPSWTNSLDSIPVTLHLVAAIFALSSTELYWGQSEASNMLGTPRALFVLRCETV